MSENKPRSYDTSNLEGELLTGGPSLKTLTIILLALLVIAGAAAAWFLEVGVSPRAKRENLVKSARQSLGRGNVEEAVIHFRNAIDADPSSADTIHDLGTAYLRLGNQREAFAQFLRAIQIKPDLISARYQLGKLLATGKALAQADEQLLAIRQLNPNAVEGTLLGSDIAVAEGNLDLGLAILNDAIQRDPKRVFYLNAGALYLRKKDYKGAERAYYKILDIEPNYPYARTALAAVYLAQGNSNKAEEELIAATKANPENEEMVKVLGNFYSITRQLDRLEILYRDLLERRPDSFVAKKVLAELSFQKGDLKQAKLLSSAVLKQHSADVDGRYFRGRILLAERDYEKAVQELSSVVVDSPQHPPAFYYLALAKMGVGKIDEARNALIKATELAPGWIVPRMDLAGLYLANGDHRLALRESQTVLDVDPKHRSALYVAAGALYEKSDYEKAVELFKRIQKFFPRDSAAHFGLAGVYMAQFKHAPALTEYEEALKLDPNRLDALNSIALILVKLGKIKEALERVELQMTHTKDKAGIYQILGHISVISGNPKKGTQFLEKAIEINPQLNSAYLMIGNVHAKNQDFDHALAQYQKVAQTNPKAIPPQMLIATMHDRKKEYTQANRYYEKILDINPNFAPAANNFAWNIAEYGGNLDVALRWAEKARENDPDNPLVADTLGWVMYRRGLYAKSVDILKTSNDQLRAKNPTVLYHLGMALYRDGKRDQARVHLQKSLELSKNFSGAQEASRTLFVLGGGN